MGLAALPGCSEGADPGTGAFPPRCGLPTPEPGVETAAVPEAFLLDGVQAVKVHRTKERLSVALNNPRSVEASFDAFKKAVDRTGFESVGEDFEGFEAEIYIQKGAELGTIQIRTSRCSEASVAFINIVRT